MTLPHEDYGTFMGMYQACWIALAHEKVGLCEGALRFADLQLETDILKAGTPLKKWPQVIAYACKGRVLAKLDRHDEALVAFQAAIAVSKESYSLMEAFALRELANYTDGGGDAAVQAGKDLEAKLDTFKGQMTREDFDGLTIAPCLAEERAARGEEQTAQAAAFADEQAAHAVARAKIARLCALLSEHNIEHQ